MITNIITNNVSLVMPAYANTILTHQSDCPSLSTQNFPKVSTTFYITFVLMCISQGFLGAPYLGPLFLCLYK